MGSTLDILGERRGALATVTLHHLTSSRSRHVSSRRHREARERSHPLAVQISQPLTALQAMPTPLPKASSPEVQSTFEDHPNHLSAYNICLKYESELTNAQPYNDNKVRYVRILGFLLLHAPKLSIRTDVSLCIHSRKDNSDLSDVGEFFERHVILACESYVCHLHSGIVCIPIFCFVQSKSSKVGHRIPVPVNILQGPPLKSRWRR